jgi:hypothetical protein
MFEYDSIELSVIVNTLGINKSLMKNYMTAHEKLSYKMYLTHQNAKSVICTINMKLVFTLHSLLFKNISC